MNIGDVPTEGATMNQDPGKKIENKAEELKGKAKEGVGNMTDDERLANEGRVDQAKGKVKEAAEKVKDVFRT
jgi:uncharacterized protein YjbJ (UPF0337 family)